MTEQEAQANEEVVAKEEETGNVDIGHTIQELSEFLTAPNPRLRAVAVQHMFALTGHDEYMGSFRAHPEAAEGFAKVIRGEIVPPIKHDAYSALINLSADHVIAETLVDNPDNLLIPELITEILDKKSTYADMASIVLANLTRNTEHAVVSVLKLPATALNPAFDAKAAPLPEEDVEGEVIYTLLSVFANEKYNEAGQTLHWLGAVFANITQNPLGRKVVLNRKRFAFQRLLSFISHPEVIRRGGAVAMIRNCTFDESVHPWLLSEEVDILPYVLLPLAGPEELSDEDMEGMPDELQFLPEDKEREPDAKLRLMLLEILLQLCTTKHGREVCRDKKVYPIIRELHKAEKTSDLEKSIYDLVNILMNDEDPEVDNLKTVVVPEDVKVNPQYAEALQATEAAQEELKKSMYNERLYISTYGKPTSA